MLAPLRAALNGAESELRERSARLLATVAPDTLARFPGLPGVLVFEEDDEDSGRPRPRLERVAGAVGGAPPPGSARACGSATWIAASPVAERAAPLTGAAGSMFL